MIGQEIFRDMTRDRYPNLTFNLIIGLIGLYTLLVGISSHDWLIILSGASLVGAVVGTLVLQSCRNRRGNGSAPSS